MLIYCLEKPQIKILSRFSKKFKFINIRKKIPTNAEILYIKLKHFIDKKIINKNSNLRFLLSPTTGTNHIDLKMINENGIKLLNLNAKDKEIKTITSTGEYTLTLILAATRRLFDHFRNNSKFNKKNRYLFKIFQFQKYKVGIIGTGRIGTYLNRHLIKLDYQTITYDRKKDKLSKLKKLLVESDIISININANNNLNFIDKKKLQLMKKNVIFINTSRGEVVNEKDLISFLRKNKSSSAFLDVIKNEQKNLRKNLLLEYQKKNKNLTILPHLGGATVDAMEIADNYIFEKLIKEYEKKN